MKAVLWCDGTWSEPGKRSSVSEHLRSRLDPELFEFTYVDYPGAFGPATGLEDMAPAESIRLGISAMAREVAATPHRAIVGGYSQGAMVAVRFAREILPSRPELIVDAVATLGDPYCPRHEGGRSGIAGARSTTAPRLTEYVPGDPIADLPAGSPLRSIADITEWMSIRSAEDAHRWGAKTLGKVPTALQAWWAPWRWTDLVSAGQYAQNYLGDHHTWKYINGGYVDRLVRRIEQFA